MQTQQKTTITMQNKYKKQKWTITLRKNKLKHHNNYAKQIQTNYKNAPQHASTIAAYDKKIKLGRRGEMGGVGPSADLESFLLYYHPDIHSKFFKKASENIEKGTDHIKWYEENYGGPVHRYI